VEYAEGCPLPTKKSEEGAVSPPQKIFVFLRENDVFRCTFGHYFE